MTYKITQYQKENEQLITNIVSFLDKHKKITHLGNGDADADYSYQFKKHGALYTFEKISVIHYAQNWRQDVLVTTKENYFMPTDSFRIYDVMSGKNTQVAHGPLSQITNLDGFDDAHVSTEDELRQSVVLKKELFEHVQKRDSKLSRKVVRWFA